MDALLSEVWKNTEDWRIGVNVARDVNAAAWSVLMAIASVRTVSSLEHHVLDVDRDGGHV